MKRKRISSYSKTLTERIHSEVQSYKDTKMKYKDTTDSDNSDETYDLSDDSIIENEYENFVVEQISLMEINNEQISQVTDILQQDILFDYSSNSVFTYFNL